MTLGYYHTLQKLISSRVRCPVCHEEVYSAAGVHPQCAERVSDPNQGKKRVTPHAPRTSEELPAGQTCVAIDADPALMPAVEDAAF